MAEQTSDLKSASVDQNEMEMFENYESFWWDPNGRLKGLHQMNNTRIPFIVNCLKDLGQLDSKYANTSKPLTNIKIADIGCGGGICTEPIAQLGADVIGIEPCTEILQLAKRHANENKNITQEIKYINSTVEDLSEEPKYRNYFDAVVNFDVAEHVADLDSLIKSCVDILKPGGSIFYSTFNKTPIAWTYCIVFWEYITDIAPNGVHELEKFVTPEDSIALFEKYNCKVQIKQGSFHYADKWFWTKNDSLHYYIHAIKKK